MESLNMSRLNLSGVASQTIVNTAADADKAKSTRYDENSLADSIDDDYHCEYSEEIWKNLLEQDSEKPVIHLQSPQLEFRGALVQQLRDVTRRLRLSIATLHTAVAQLDLFMDAHTLRADRLSLVALACLSLAAKSEEKFSRAPSLKKLAKVSGVKLNGKVFRQLEWMVGQHANWRLLAPTPVTFAGLLVHYVVSEEDLTTRHPKFVRRFKRDGAKLLEAYLDLTLSDVRLKVVESVDVGCACVACARADLGLGAWPARLERMSGRRPADVAPIARLLQRMMQILKSRETTNESETDQGYGSARCSPNITPPTSPRNQVSPSSSDTSNSSQSVHADASYRHRPLPRRHENEALDLSDANTGTNATVQNYFNLPATEALQRVNNPADYRYYKSSRLLENSLDSTMVVPTTNVAVKRGLDTNIELDSKRVRLTAGMAKVL